MQAIADIEEQAIRKDDKVDGIKSSNLERVIDFGTEGGLLTVPPGFSRGLDFTKASQQMETAAAKQIEETLTEQPDELTGGVAVDDMPNGHPINLTR